MTTVRIRIEKWFASLAQNIYHHPLKTLFMMLVIIAAIVSQIPKLTIDVSTEGFMHK